MNIVLPKTLQALSNDHKLQIVSELSKALNVKSPKASGLERTVWATNDEQLLGEAEDELYEILVGPAMENMAELIAALDLSDEPVKLQKAFSLEFLAYEDQLFKSLDNGKHKLSDLINLSKTKRNAFTKLLQEGTEWTKAKLKQIDDIMKQKLPDYAKLAEQFSIRAAFIAKIRSHSDTEMLSTVGAFVDRFPSTIKAAEHEGLVLTLKEQERAKAEGRKVKILPLQPQELRAVEHANLRAGEKIADVSDKHRKAIKQIIIYAINGRWTPQRLAQELFDKFGELNSDFRRIAITEMAMASSDAFLAGCSEGDTVICMVAPDACKYCKKLLEGKEFKVTNDLKLMGTTQDFTHVWVGKSNFGRKAADYVPCIPLHPLCRCRYHTQSRFYKTDENGKQKLKTTVELIQEERIRRGLGLDPNLK